MVNVISVIKRPPQQYTTEINGGLFLIFVHSSSDRYQPKRNRLLYQFTKCTFGLGNVQVATAFDQLTICIYELVFHCVRSQAHDDEQFIELGGQSFYVSVLCKSYAGNVHRQLKLVASN